MMQTTKIKACPVDIAYQEVSRDYETKRKSNRAVFLPSGLMQAMLECIILEVLKIVDFESVSNNFGYEMRFCLCEYDLRYYQMDLNPSAFLNEAWLY